MRIGILGTGIVGTTLGSRLVQGGHEVRMGSREAGNPRAREWVEAARAAAKGSPAPAAAAPTGSPAAAAASAASEGSFADAAAFGEVLFNCTAGSASLGALEMAGRANLSGKILIDVANPLDFSRGMPPSLTVCNTDSLGEQIQRAFPEARVVKTLNTVNCAVMVEPGLVPGEHHLFLSGNDAEAKAQVAGWLEGWFGWPAARILDLGDITTARGAEMILPMWVQLMGALGTATFNWHLARP